MPVGLAAVQQQAGAPGYGDAHRPAEGAVPRPGEVREEAGVGQSEEAGRHPPHQPPLAGVLGVEAQAEHGQLGADEEGADFAQDLQHRGAVAFGEQDGRCHHQHSPEHGEPAGDGQAALRRGVLVEELLVKVQGGHRGHGVEAGVQAGHGGGHHGGGDQAHQSGQADGGHELQHDLVAVLELPPAVVAPEQQPQAEEQGVDGEGGVAHQDVRLLGVPQGAGGQGALHHHLVHPIDHHMVDGHGDQAGPDGGHLGGVQRMGEGVGAALRLQRRQGVRQRLRQFRQHHRENDEGAGEQHRGLHQIRPDHRRNAAQQGVGQGHRGDYEDGVGDVHAGDELQHQGGGVKHDAGVHEVAEQENGGHQCARRQAEAPLQVVEDGGDAAVVEEGQKDRDDDEDGDGIVDVDEDHGKSFLVGPGRAAEKGQCADVGGHHGQADHRPGRGPLAQIVVLRRAHPLAEQEADEDGAGHVGGQDGPVEGAEVSHVAGLPGCLERRKRVLWRDVAAPVRLRAPAAPGRAACFHVGLRRTEAPAANPLVRRSSIYSSGSGPSGAGRRSR